MIEVVGTGRWSFRRVNSASQAFWAIGSWTQVAPGLLGVVKNT
jgi:hypothetical protein